MTAPMLSFEGVTVRYNGNDPPALDDLNLTIVAGERVALIGPSGAGKSTIIALANGLTLPNDGVVNVLGVDTRYLGHRQHRQTRKRIGTVHQNFALVGPLWVAHNVAAGRLGQWGWARALRSLVRPIDLEEISDRLSEVGIGQKLWDRADQLSGGQQQRVAIARVLFQGPDLLLADEPVSALDPARSDAVMKVLVAAGTRGSRRALVASLHDAPLARAYCERIVGVRDGRVVFDLPTVDVSSKMLTELYEIDGDDLPATAGQ